MKLFRSSIDQIEGYVPGEQPQEPGWVKLNTNENPYPPSLRVVAAIEASARGRLNVYPDPLATRFREKVAELFHVDPDWILPGNGSDEILTILVRSFVDPQELVAYPYPSYILYETLAGIQGARHERLPLNEDWSWNHEDCRPIVARSKLVFVPNPNSPSGNLWPDSDLVPLVPPEGILVVDQAYGDFCDRPAQTALLESELGRRIVITRTLSKSYSLAGIRCGFAIAHPDLISGMRKAKDSYNCNTLSLAGDLAALADQDWMHKNVDRIRATRARLTENLRERGFHVVESQANFVWATHPDRSHHDIYEDLKRQKILVRYMQFPNAGPDAQSDIDGLRITIGTDDEIEQFLMVLDEIM